ncbi:putative xyloglucan endotransglucosylase/hydrolase protein 26 [Hordeum vulgare]|nr:putative xyloglucan endotransglucosylase/hydrolase protein 26 [Hordeum vulgare]
METKTLHDHCAHRRSPTKLQGSEALVLINTSKKDRDDDDAAAKGFPRYVTRQEEGSPRRPPGRSGGTHGCRRVGVGQADRGFPRSQPSPRMLQSLPPNRPPSYATAVMKPPCRLTTTP